MGQWKETEQVQMMEKARAGELPGCGFQRWRAMTSNGLSFCIFLLSSRKLWDLEGQFYYLQVEKAMKILQDEERVLWHRLYHEHAVTLSR